MNIYTLSLKTFADSFQTEEELMARILELSAGLSDQRRSKIAAARFAGARLQSLGAGLLLDYGLRQFGLRERESAVSYKQNGKPYLAACPEIHFNLSHSGNLVMAVFSDRETGCDVEQTARCRMDVAKRFFAPRETEYLAGLSGRAQDEAFYRLWTLKESFIKATGEGMRMALDQFSVEIGAEGEPVRLYCKGKDGGYARESGYQFREFSLDDCRAAVCVRNQKQDRGEDVFFSFQNLWDVV